MPGLWADYAPHLGSKKNRVLESVRQCSPVFALSAVNSTVSSCPSALRFGMALGAGLSGNHMICCLLALVLLQRLFVLQDERDSRLVDSDNKGSAFRCERLNFSKADAPHDFYPINHAAPSSDGIFIRSSTVFLPTPKRAWLISWHSRISSLVVTRKKCEGLFLLWML